MTKIAMTNFKWAYLLTVVFFLTACGGTVSVPITIHSEPLGGHVTYQLPPNDGGGSADWIYLGKTPIDINQLVSKKQLKNARVFRMKVFKGGYNDQVRDWNEDDIEDAIDEKGHIFWNPRLVPNGS